MQQTLHSSGGDHEEAPETSFDEYGASSGLFDCMEHVIDHFPSHAIAKSDQPINVLLSELVAQYELDRSPPPAYVDLVAVLRHNAAEELCVVDVFADGESSMLDRCSHSLATAQQLLANAAKLRRSGITSMLPWGKLEHCIAMRRKVLALAKEANELLRKMKTTSWVNFLNENFQQRGLQPRGAKEAVVLKTLGELSGDRAPATGAASDSPGPGAAERRTSSAASNSSASGWIQQLSLLTADGSAEDEARLLRIVAEQVTRVATVFQTCLPILELLQQLIVVRIETVTFLPLPADCPADTPAQKVVTVTPTTKIEQILLNSSSLRLWAALLLGRSTSHEQHGHVTPSSIHGEVPHKLASRIKQVIPLPGNAPSIDHITCYQLFFELLYSNFHAPWSDSGAAVASAESSSSGGGIGGLAGLGIRNLWDFISVEHALYHKTITSGKSIPSIGASGVFTTSNTPQQQGQPKQGQPAASAMGTQPSGQAASSKK